MIDLILLLVGLSIVIDSPAKSYELSIYSSTPISFWICTGAVIFLSLIISLNHSSKKELFSALTIASISIITIVSLPIIRNYCFFGMSDSITHLGIVNNILEGKINADTLFYPGIHLQSVFLSSLTGLPVRISLLMIIPIYAIIYLVFIVLFLRYQYGKFDNTLLVIGVYSAFLFLPINNNGIYFEPHPSSQAVLFFPVLIYLFLKYNNEKSIRLFAIFLVLFLGLLFIHPQHALSFILCISAIIILSKGFSKKNSFTLRVPLIFTIIFWIWVTISSTFPSSLKNVFNRLIYGDLGLATGIIRRGMSLSLVGGNLVEIFFKMFFVTLLFGILTLIYLYKFRKTKAIDKERVQNLFFGLIAISLLFFVYIIVLPGPGQAFRYLGVICVLLTVTGAYSLFCLIKNTNHKIKNVVIIAIFLVCLLLSISIYFDSPWNYNGNQQITQSDFDGYKTSFSFINNSLEFSSIRLESSRFYATIRGINWTSISSKKFISSPNHFDNHSLSKYYKHQTYLAITESELIIDAQLYQGFRFSYNDFNYLKQDNSIEKIQTNGGYNLFIINPV